jgi:predicted cytidylate kinase
MPEGRSIVINGDLGSGKSTVTTELATRLGMRRVAMGDVHRAMAKSRGMTTLELNQHAELDKAVDDDVDQVQRDLAASGEELVVDSRLGWHFFQGAFKVHMIIDPAVAARRVTARPASAVEGYASLEQAEESLRKRSDSERVRFIERYGVDKYLLRNYDLVCDTTRAAVGDIVDLIVAAYQGELGADILRQQPPLLLIDPARIYPSHELAAERLDKNSEYVEEVGRGGPAGLPPLEIGYARPHFYVVEGHRKLSAALLNGFTLVPARLVGQDGDVLTEAEAEAEATSVEAYFEARVRPELVREWSGAHGIDLPVPARPHGSRL